MARRHRRHRFNDIEDDAAELLAIFYHYVIDRCESGSLLKLQKLLETLESLANDKEKLRKLKREVRKQFEEDEIFCQIISRNSRL